MQSITEHIERVFSDYFSSSEIHQLKIIVKNTLPAEFSAGNESEFISAENYSSGIDTLITYAAGKLNYSRLIDLLLHLGEYSISLGEMNTAVEVYKQILTVSDDLPDLQNVKAYSFMALGDIYSRQAEWQKSIRYLNKAKKLFNEQKDFRGSARCENILGTIYGDKGNMKKAKMHFEKSLNLLNQKQDEYLIGMIEINLGIINNIQGNYDQAFTYHQRAIFKFEQMQDFRRLAEVRNNLGMMHTQKGEYNAALNVYDESIAVSLKSGYLPTLVVSYLSKSFIYAKLNDFVLAKAFSDKAMDGAVKLNDRLSVADIYKIKGIIEKNLKNYVAAENYFVTSIRINVELENILNLAESSLELGMMYIEMKKKKQALEQLQIALENYRKLDSEVMISKLEEMIRGVQ